MIMIVRNSLTHHQGKDKDVVPSESQEFQIADVFILALLGHLQQPAEEGQYGEGHGIELLHIPGEVAGSRTNPSCLIEDLPQYKFGHRYSKTSWAALGTSCKKHKSNSKECHQDEQFHA
eukprot:scaffold177277_cov42-Prasinocladus_malaysianus.AAC.2